MSTLLYNMPKGTLCIYDIHISAQELIKKQAAQNRAKSLRNRKQAPGQDGGKEDEEDLPIFPQEHYIALLRYSRTQFN